MKFVRIEDLDLHKLYKMCQVTIKGFPLMYFVEDDRGCYHKNILKEVLTLNALTHTVIKVLGDEGLVYCGESFVVNGMGGATLLSKKHVLLFGNSVNFDMSISSAHVEEFRKIDPEWRFKISPSKRESFAS